MQGIGGALLEELAYDADGNPVATTFMDYLLPTATEVPVIDSTALAVLVVAHKRLRRTGRELVVVLPRSGMTTKFEIAGLDRFFSISHTRAEALAPPVLDAPAAEPSPAPPPPDPPPPVSAVEGTPPPAKSGNTG